MEDMLLPLTTSQWVLELILSLLLVRLGWIVKTRVKEYPLSAWGGILIGSGSAVLILVILLYKLLA